MDGDTAGLENALGAAFSDAPPAPAKAPVAPQKPAAEAVAPEPEPEALEPTEPAETDPADLLETEPEPEKKEEEAEPEFEIEIEAGKPEVLPLGRLKELAARGAKAGRAFEENARVREALQAHVQQAQMQTQFQQAVSEDVAQLQALDKQLESFNKIDWSAAYDSDPFNALKLKEQRDQLREQRAAALQGLNAKQQQFQAHMQQTAQKALAAESEALLAKVPTWRNAEKAAQEKGEIAALLSSYYGYAQSEIANLMDHRALLVARDAAAYRKLLANKDAKVKQAREAPATAKPGPSTQTNGRTEFQKARGLLKAHGAKGNHRAQESLATQLFERAFK
jgi:hypothetical protein